MPPEWKRDGRWKVEWQRPMGATIWRPQDVKLWVLDQQKSGIVKGFELLKIIRKNGIPVLPDAILDYFLSNPKDIPEEWKDKAVFFWGRHGSSIS